jgi:hypothetical protein
MVAVHPRGSAGEPVRRGSEVNARVPLPVLQKIERGDGRSLFEDVVTICHGLEMPWLHVFAGASPEDLTALGLTQDLNELRRRS